MLENRQDKTYGDPQGAAQPRTIRTGQRTQAHVQVSLTPASSHPASTPQDQCSAE